jgi:hypothetical protein
VFGSLLLYAGGLVAAFGALTLLRPFRRLGVPTRRRAAAVLGAGLVCVAVAVALPAPLRRVAMPATKLDGFAPAWQFGEHHETVVRATPERVEAAVRAVTAEEIRFFRALTWIRNPSRSWNEQPPNLLAPPRARPILDVALGGGFLMLAEEPRRELVLGALVATPPELARLPAAELARLRREFGAERFRTLDAAGYAKAVLSFHLADRGDGTTWLATTTRVFATDPATARRFAVYWRVIYPGSSLLRRSWLAAIRRRAEGPAG